MMLNSPYTRPQFWIGRVHFLVASNVAKYKCGIAREYASLAVELAVCSVQALYGVCRVYDLPDAH